MVSDCHLGEEVVHATSCCGVIDQGTYTQLPSINLMSLRFSDATRAGKLVYTGGVGHPCSFMQTGAIVSRIQWSLAWRLLEDILCTV